MGSWDYKGMGELSDNLQINWNQTLLTKINKLNGRLPDKDDPIEVKYSSKFIEDDSTKNVIESNYIFKVVNYG
jgi:hypothetical protein